MRINITTKGVVEIDDAKLIFRNFAGAQTQYNRKGDRNFAIVIPDTEIFEALKAEGWNVKMKPGREEGDEPFMYLSVKVTYGEKDGRKYGPAIRVKSNGKITELTEENVGMLDSIDILYCGLDIRPYDWNVNGKSGRTAYLNELFVEQRVSRFATEYAEDELPF